MIKPTTSHDFDAYIRSIQWPAIKTHHQKSDVTGKTVWDDYLTVTLLTGSYIFPQHRPSYYRNHTRCGRNELLSAYILQQTGVYRTAKQCGSKVLHLTRIDVMKGLLAERPQVPKSYRDALITTLMPLLSKMRSLATKFCASKRNHPTQPQLSTLIVSRGAATMTHRVGDHLPATPLSQDIISAIGATKALLDFSPSAPILHAHLSLPPGLTLAQWSGIRLELHAPGASALDYDTFTYVRGSPQSEIFVKASPYADGAFRSPVAPTFLTDLLKSWGDDETRSRLLPGVMVIQRCSTRRRVSDEGTRGDVVAIIYTLDVAPTPEAASVTLAHMCSLLPEHMSDEGSSHGAEESWSMMEWNPEVNFPLTASGVYMPLESMASSTWTSLPSSSVSSEDISFSFHLDAPSTFDTPLLSSFPEASYNSDSLPPPPIPMSPHLHLQTPKPRKTIRMNSMYLESMIFAAKSGINPFQQMGGNAGLAATKFTSLLSGWNKM